MATWEVTGAELAMGKETKRSIVAATEAEAREEAETARIAVSDVRKTSDYPLVPRSAKPVEYATAQPIHRLSRFVNAALWTTVALSTVGFLIEAFNVIGGLYTWMRSTPMNAGRGFPSQAPSELIAFTVYVDAALLIGCGFVVAVSVALLEGLHILRKGQRLV